MMQVSLNKQYVIILILLFIWLFCINNSSFASNPIYIMLSGQIARQQQLQIIANNTANAATDGFEQDQLLLQTVNLKQNNHRNHSFVWSEATYRSGEMGPIKSTNRPTDLAIIEQNAYFKILTPNGERYTLNGAMLINSQGILTNHSGYPYLSIENAPIEIPAGFTSLNIADNGNIFVDEVIVGQIGVFRPNNKNDFQKEGGSLYASQAGGIALEEFTVKAGTLRSSNVNHMLGMVQTIEVQKAFTMLTGLISDIGQLDASAIHKITK